MSGAAVCWSVLYPTTGGQTLWITGLTAAAWWLPWDKLVTLRRILWLIASGAALMTGISVLELSVPTIPLWQWIVGWVLILAVLLYCGGKPLYEASILVGLLAAGVLLLSFCIGLPMYDGVIEWGGGSITAIAGGTVVLLGCGLTGRELAQDKKAAKWGGLFACLLWGLCAALPLLLWSQPALAVLQYPLLSCWQRLDFFSLFACPDALLAALVGLLALWQNSAALQQLKLLVKK